MKFEPEDFIVEEIPLYEPTGLGTHTYFGIRKRNLSTFQAIRRIADILQVNQRDIGYAGLKDKSAITTQTLSVEGIAPEQLLKIEEQSMKVLWAERHPHKLRVGHLRGNKFTVTLRSVSRDKHTIVTEKMEKLTTEGVPNRFGAQRFGNKQNTHLIGKAFVKGDWDKVLDYISTYEVLESNSNVVQIDVEKAIRNIPHRLKKLYLSAYQSFLFNCILERRSPDIGRLLDGDIAIKHINNAPFRVENASVEQMRADDLEISPTGPIFGYKMQQPMGEVKNMEMELLSEEGVKPEAFRKVAGIRLPGTRRPLRMFVEGHQVVPIDDVLRLSFTLPAGGYATVVLDELLRSTI